MSGQDGIIEADHADAPSPCSSCTSADFPSLRYNAIEMADPRACGAPADPLPRACGIGIVAFYFPGQATFVDEVCGAGFLGNFFPIDSELDASLMLSAARLPDTRDHVHFHNAEAAFQALKWWTHQKHREAFSSCKTGEEAAFRLKRTLERNGSNDPDRTYAQKNGDGAGCAAKNGRWCGMLSVLRAKFGLGTGSPGWWRHNRHSRPPGGRE